MAIEVEVGGVYEIAADLTPTGGVIAFAGVSAPVGWLICDGSAVNRGTYRNLYDVILTSFETDISGADLLGSDFGTAETQSVRTYTIGNSTAEQEVMITGDPRSDGINETPKLSSESRPKNIAMNYIIKT